MVLLIQAISLAALYFDNVFIFRQVARIKVEIINLCFERSLEFLYFDF